MIPRQKQTAVHIGCVCILCTVNFFIRYFFNLNSSTSLRGKGDYHRLGHGTDDHVRRPRRVSSLQGKKVIDVACGSLHCVACTDTGTGFCTRLSA